MASKFTAIGKDVYLSTGQKPAAHSDSDSGPSLILIFGWMGAQLPHLYKYTTAYDKLYPEATQVLVRTEPSFFWSSIATRRFTLEPVVDVLEALGCVHPVGVKQPGPAESMAPVPRILIHSFSNGGAYQLVTLGQLLTAKQLTTSVPLTNALIFDSAPGGGDLHTTKLAFTAHIPPGVQRTLASVFVTLLYFVLQIILHVPNQATILKDALLNEESMPPWLRPSTSPDAAPGSSKHPPRMYVYSKSDKLIPYLDVEEHIQRSRGYGLNVSSCVYEDSPHVAHARADPERYWNSVKRVWAEAVEQRR